MSILDIFSAYQKSLGSGSGPLLGPNFKALYENSQSPAFILDLKGAVITVNKQLTDFLGYSLKEIKNLNTSIIFDRFEKVQHHFAMATKGIPSLFDTTLINKKGNPVPVNIMFIPCIREEQADLIIGLCRDLTGLENYEKLKENLEEAQRISRIGSWEYDVVNDKSYWSKQTYKIFGMDNLNIIPDWDKVLSFSHPNDREKWESLLTNAIKYKRDVSFENRIIRKDGKERVVLQKLEVKLGESGDVVRFVGTIQDITDYRIIKKKLAESNSQFQSIADHLPVAIWSLDTKRNQISFCSKGVEVVYGVAQIEFRDNPLLWLKYVHPEDRLMVEMNQEKMWHGEELVHSYRIIDKNGNIKWVEDQALPYVGEDGEITRIDGIVRDITKEKEYSETLFHMANYDYLTNLPNRTNFEEKLNEHIQEAGTEDKQFAIFRLGLDRFKSVNDTLGLNIGDQLLIAIASRLKNLLDRGDFLARIAGDEFAICIEGIKEMDEAIPIAKKIIKEMEKPFFVEDYELFITVSIGISFFPLDGDNSSTLLISASHALKKVKELGRNDWQIFTPSMNIQSFKTFQLESDLHKAMMNNEFYLEYQPKVDTGTGRVKGAEALIRWNHPDWGRVSPGEFIAMAEENGLILEMGDWVLKEVCVLQSKWKKETIPIVPISINISPKHLLKADFTKNVRNSINAAGIEPNLIELELTESVILKNIEKAKQVISDLKDFGVKFALDDFGTGYSSLSYLMELDIDTLKIDKSFIDGIGIKKSNEGIIKSSIFLSKELGMEVVAEGVEEKNQLNFLLQQECHQIQGYIFSKPVKETEFKNLLMTEVLTPNRTESSKDASKNRRKYYRLKFDIPLCADMTVTKFKNKDIKLGTSKVLVEDISLGGLRYLSNINLPIQEDLVLLFTTTILGNQYHLTGRNVWKLEVNGLYQYGFEFNLTETERDKLAPTINQLTLQLKSNPSLPNCRFLQGNKMKYFYET